MLSISMQNSNSNWPYEK